MRYIEPTMKITAFDAENIVTASNPSDAANNVFNVIDSTTTYSATYAVNVEEVMGLMK